MRSLTALLLLAVLSSCGFHLREVRPLPFATIYVSVPGTSELGAALRRSINATGGTQVLDSPEGAQALMEVIGEAREKTILSLDAAGRVREFQLRTRFVFRVNDGKGRVVVPRSEIVLHRDITFNDSAVLAKEAEELLLYRDMQNDVVQQVMRRLAAARIGG